LRNILTYYSEYICDSYQLPFKKRHLQDCIIDPVRYKERKANQQFRFMPQEDCERFLHELKKRAEKEQKYFIYYLLGLLQLRTGIRVGEACALDFSDIQWATNQIRIKKTVHWSRKKGVQTRVFPMTKSGKPRWVFISEELAQALSKWGQIIERSVGLIFSFDGFKPVCYRSVQYHYNTAFKLAEVDWSSTHILRHSFATDFLEKTQNPHALKELMGHSALKQTEHYSKVTEKLIERGALEYQKQLEQAGKVIRIH
jgi:integrase